MSGEDEQLESLRRWWIANGKSLVTGVVIGLLIIGGWQFWKHHERSKQMGGSALYARTLKQLQADHAAKAESLANRLVDGYSGTPYAAQGQLAMAGYEADHGDYAKAAKRLHWVSQNANDKGLKLLGRLREARALWGAKQPEKALKLLSHDVPQGGFASLFYELKGDILVSEKKSDQASEAYQLALSNAPPDADSRPRLQVKLNDLRSGSEEQ